MPAHRLGRLKAPKFAIVGEHTDDTAFVQHVGVLQRDTDLSPGCKADVYHVGPGFKFKEARYVQVVAYHPAISTEKIAKGDIWIREVALALPPDGVWQHIWYAAHPPCPSTPPGEEVPRLSFTPGQRYSCIGFILRLYQVMLGDVLIDYMSSKLPPVNESDLQQIYPWLQRDHLSDYGLPPDDEPWRVTLPGYVFHALEPSRPAFRYVPRSFEKSAFPLLPAYMRI